MPAKTGRREISAVVMISVATVVAVVRFWLGVTLPLIFLPSAGADDGLFMGHAASILAGHWLGHFNQYTLVKGPGYPLFLAFASLTGLPVSAVQAIFQLVAIGLIAWAVLRLSGRRLLALATFVLLALHPVAFSPRIWRVIRDQIYWGQVLIVVALLAIVFVVPLRSRRTTAWASVVAGLCLGWAWLTREEGVWLVPGLLVLAAGSLLIDRSSAAVRMKLGNLLLVLVAFAAVEASFLSINKLAYGSFVGVDVKERNFVRALDALQGVQIAKVPDVPVSNQALTAIAAVSPDFAPLAQALLPGGAAAGWANYGCEIYPAACGQIAGGWFLWALRDAATVNGDYRTPASAAQAFGRIADEVDGACADGKLPCRTSPIDLMPPLSPEQISAIPASLTAVIAKFAYWNIPADAPSGGEHPAAGSPGYAMWSLVNYPRIFDGQETASVRAAADLRSALIDVYRIGMPLLAGVGLVVFLVSLGAWRDPARRPLLLFAGTAWILVATRAAVLTLVDVSSFPAANLLYGAPAVYLLTVAGLLSIALPLAGRTSPATTG